MSVTSHNADLAQALLGCSYDELNPVQRSVIDLIATEAPSGLNPQLTTDDRTFWQRLADTIAAVGGSWTFIFSFLAVLVAWVTWNALAHRLAFDPYPFIFLNLVMSMIAALQAPVIMMSQNRAAARDRANAEHDYVVNLRAELEIMHLHDKLDALRNEELVKLVTAQNETLTLLKAQMAALAAKD
ncbi:DUF1003 domain-containing protein [Phenylobacterium sp. 20VBR1]|uniref:DUF1003 domain-containing protein n=1 Tax=Phenylobacterium glaciei TaxID=2803784 RepID=A0A941HXW0_9CAUL|nr:DUF1003 domain-containing protein [Phenylobacterium glaciei]MBR7620717.1 DUF1003 domain-containing protein [Phenylobacterium glaciei]